ncbi:MAG: hypothetical protein FGM24_04915 [Candidatus Kapabacteria bacterium]|nr:hypothetical protein [Candidatus Kapabacteria bacterium]
MTARLTSLLAALLAIGVATAQDHPNVRHMERAHPTPLSDSKLQEHVLKLPFVTEQMPYTSQFENTNLIVGVEEGLPAQNESSIAVNPRNPRNVIGAAVDYRNNSSRWVYYTTNSGRTWINKDLGKAQNGWPSGNDPSVAFDHLGRGYLCYGAFNRTGNAQFGENGIFVAYTDDGGTTWPGAHIPVIVHTGMQTADSAFEDKYYIHADTAASSPFRGRLYIPWKRVINRDSSTQIVISHSTDRGRSWTVPSNVSARFSRTSEDTTFGQSFPLARTGPDGTVHVVWNSGTERAVRYARSTDGGGTFSEPRILHRYQSFGTKSEVAGSVNSRVKGVVRAEAYPTLVVDCTNGPRNGWLYLVWSADAIPNVYFSRSTDNGDTWSTPIIVHNDTSNDQFWPWLALDPTNGDLAVMYFDSRDDAENILVNCYVSYSRDGGTTWTDRRTADEGTDLRRNPFAGSTFAGDYSGCDFHNGIVYPSWVDMRNTYTTPSDNDVYTAIVKVNTPSAPSTFTATTLPQQPTSIALAWSAVSDRTFGQPLDLQRARYVLRRDGAPIATLGMTDTTFLDTGLTKYRRYAYSLAVVDDVDTSTARSASAFAGGSKEPGIPKLLSVTGSETGTIIAFVELPKLRLDGVTTLVNLASLSFKANAWSATEGATQAGAEQAFTLAPNANGWYRVSVQAVDADGNVSPSSDTLICYTGGLEWNKESFDSLPALNVIKGNWGRSTSFAFSDPASYTDSPSGNYTQLRHDTVMLYPRRVGRGTDLGNTIVSMRIAAFLDNGDTAFVEHAYDAAGPWSTDAKFNAGTYARWADTTKSADAWRYERLTIRTEREDTLFLRLRMRTNATRNSDGVYIDDITIEETTSVDEAADAVLGVHPMPASTSVVVGLSSDAAVTTLRVIAIDGSSVAVPWDLEGRTLVVDIRSLAPGTYTLHVTQGSSVHATRIVVYR